MSTALRSLTTLLAGILLSASAQAGMFDALMPSQAAPVQAIAAATDKDNEITRIRGRLERIQTILQTLNNAEASSPKGLELWAENEKRRFWLELERQAYLQHLAALEGIKAQQARQRENTNSYPKASEQTLTQQFSFRLLTEQEVDYLQKNLTIQERYLESISDELRGAEAELRQSQETLEKAAVNSSARSQAAKAMELSQHKKNSWSAALAASDARIRFTRLRLQERRELMLAINSATESDQKINPKQQLEAEFVRLKSNQNRYREQQQRLDNDASLLQSSLDDLKKNQENLETALNNEKTKNKEALQIKKDAIPQQILWLQLRLETNAIHFGILSDLLMSNAIQGAYWKEYSSLNKSNQISALQNLNTRAEVWLQNLSDVEKTMQIAEGIAQDQIEFLSKKNRPDEQDLMRHWQERESAYAEALTDLRRARMRFSWLKENIEDSANKSIAMRVDYWSDTLRNFSSDIWNLELFSVNDVLNIDGQSVTISRPVTIGKMLTAIMLLTIGFAISNLLINWIERRMLLRGKIAPVSIKIAKRWVLAVIFIMLLINSLLLVRIPLTVFAFMGGAVAIGLGFGMQTLLKNLISGLMMLLERPFKPGDTIEVGGLRGTVVDMSVRAAVVRDINGIDTLIPNSSFLEQNVTNWTYSSSMVRQGIKVGIAYGSDVRMAAKLLEEDVLRHGQISSERKPEILLEDFAADALSFGIYYWLDMSTGVVGRQVASDLRFMIEASFRKHDISIAFPQRDVHLDSANPLRIQIERGRTDKVSAAEQEQPVVSATEKP
jgi:potassium efflux system protein